MRSYGEGSSVFPVVGDSISARSIEIVKRWDSEGVCFIASCTESDVQESMVWGKSLSMFDKGIWQDNSQTLMGE